MQQIYLDSVFKRGYRSLMKYISNISHMDKKTQAVIYHRLDILEFFEEFGLKATKKAFKIGKSTLYLWKQKLEQGGGHLSVLAAGSRAPKSRSKRKVTPDITSFILGYRKAHPGVCKDTVKPLLDAYCLSLGVSSVSESTVGRIIAELKENNQIPSYQLKTTINGKTGNLRYSGHKPKPKKLRVGKYRPESPGDLVQIDAIEIFLYNLRRYIVTAIDIKTRFAFAYSYKTLSSGTARDFIQKFQEVAPFTIKHIQTDNGKEFHKYFRDYVAEQNIVHFYNYPKQPKMNRYIERFNRTIQEQYVSWHMNNLYEPNEFNPDLMKYLIWYNTEKQHKSLGKITPMQYFINNYIQPEKSNMLWTTTTS